MDAVVNGDGAAAELEEVEPAFGLQDRTWTEDDWHGLVEGLVAREFVSWHEVASVVLGQLNPPQVGTAIASSKSFQSNHTDPTRNFMPAVMEWFYAQAGRCADCGTRFELQADHVDPRQNYDDPGDADRLDNLELRCRRCNVIRRVSHVFGGVTYLTAEAALMWILLVLRPRTFLDFVRMCRLYGMTMADIRMQEAWAMAVWLAADPEVHYEIEADEQHAYDLLHWPDGSLTRRRSTEPALEGDPAALQGNVAGGSTIAFLTRAEDGVHRFHEIAVKQVPFSTYDLGDRSRAALAVLPTPPDRKSRTMSPLRALPPRGLELVAFLVRTDAYQAVVDFTVRSRPKQLRGPVPVRGKKLPEADSGYRLSTEQL